MPRYEIIKIPPKKNRKISLWMVTRVPRDELESVSFFSSLGKARKFRDNRNEEVKNDSQHPLLLGHRPRNGSA